MSQCDERARRGLHLHRPTGDHRSPPPMRPLNSALTNGLVKPKCANTDRQRFRPKFNGINAALEMGSVRNIQPNDPNKAPTLSIFYPRMVPCISGSLGAFATMIMRTASGSLYATNDTAEVFVYVHLRRIEV